MKSRSQLQFERQAICLGSAISMPLCLWGCIYFAVSPANGGHFFRLAVLGNAFLQPLSLFLQKDISITDVFYLFCTYLLLPVPSQAPIVSLGVLWSPKSSTEHNVLISWKVSEILHIVLNNRIAITSIKLDIIFCKNCFLDIVLNAKLL